MLRGGAGPTAPAGLVSRFRQKLCRLGRPMFGVSADAAQLSRQTLTLRAGIAELLLVTRLKARTKPVDTRLNADVLERATEIVYVTCKSWFTDADEEMPLNRKPL